MLSVDAREIQRLSKALKSDVGKEAHKAMNKRIRALAKPIAEEVQQAAMRIPTDRTYTADDIKYAKKFGMHRLRAGIAKAVELRVGSSARTSLVRIRVSGTKFNKATGKPVTLPRYMEGLSRRPWRHPVFVKRDDLPGPVGSWVEQKPHPYLVPTVMKHKTKVREEIVKSYLDSLEAVIETHGITVKHY